MPAIRADRLMRGLAKGTRGGVYLLHGSEEHLKEEAVRAIIDAHIEPATRDFNLDTLYGGSLDPETLASICATPPMMAEWRVVVVRDAQSIAANARLRGVIESVAAKPPPGLALVLSARLERSKARFWVKLEGASTNVEFPPLAAADLPGWLVARATADGVNLDPAAARALAAAVGSDLGILLRELAKLREYVGERRSITHDDVAAVVGDIPRINRWDWIDRVGERRFDEARRSLGTLLASGENGVGLVIGLGTHLLRIGIAVAGGSRALDDALPNYQRFLAGRILRQARGWDAASVDAATRDLLRADRLLKSTPLDDRQVLEELLLRLRTREAIAA